MEYILGGGGFAAIHGALFGPSACEDKWAWYGEMCCVSFKNHSAVVPALVDIEDGTNPSTAGLPKRWTRTDEWYNYDGTPRGKARVLATLDEFEATNVLEHTRTLTPTFFEGLNRLKETGLVQKVRGR